MTSVLKVQQLSERRRCSPVLVQSLLLAALVTLAVVAVGDLVVNFGSDFVLQLHDVLKGHVGQF